MTAEHFLGRVRERLESLGVGLFGDRIGVVLFLGALVWFASTWRVGFFIADTYAVANTLVNVAEGHLYINHIEYSLTLGSSQPGLHIQDGRVYGRNYGHVYVALPVYFLLKGVSWVVDLRVVLAGAVSLCVLLFGQQLGRLTDREVGGTVLGSALALGLFGSTLVSGSPLPGRWAGLLALQLTSAVAGALLAVVMYRLARAMYGSRVGVALAVAVVGATPVAFWATVPKRHVLTAALTMVTVAAFYASRGPNETPIARAGAYCAAGFTAAIHGGEGAVLVGLLIPVDILTASSNSRRDLGVAAGGLLLGLAPFLLTNTLISGNPLLAPRWLGSFNGGSIGPDGTVQTALEAVSQYSGSTGAGSVDPRVPTATANVGAVVANLLGLTLSVLATTPEYVQSILSAVFEEVERGVSAVTDPQRLYHVFVRSGQIPSVRYRLNDFAIIELTLLESMPLGGLVLTGLGVGAQYIQTASKQPVDAVERGLRTVRSDPARQTDVLVVAYLGALTAAYLPRLPLFSQITVRYLLPTMPLWLYVVVRFAPVRAAITAQPRWLARSFLGGCTAGAAVLVGVLLVIDPALGEAMQFHALVHLAVGTLTVAALLVGVVLSRMEIGSVAIGITAAVTTVFFGLLGVVYFPYGPAVLPVTEWLADTIGLL